MIIKLNGEKVEILEGATVLDVLKNREVDPKTVVVEADGEDVLERLTLEEDVEKLYRCLDAVLLPREKQIILLRYGIRGEIALTQTQVGEILDISRSYVSRIEKKALQKLKNCFENT